MNKFARIVKSPKTAIAGLSALAASAYAATPAAVDTAMGDMKTDGVSMATMFLIAVIAVASVLFLKRAIGR